jgi:DNA repair exonuclease SbcCD ATPase subunit
LKTPIRLISLSLRNFMSYGNNKTIINLEFLDPTLIVGRNLDAMVNGQIDSNGSGKSTITNALSWCLYGKPISKISADNLINNINKKNMEVTVIFEKNGKFYRVTRFRKHKVFGDNGVYIEESAKFDSFSTEVSPPKTKKSKNADEVKENAESSLAQANKQLKDIIDMPFEIFSRIIIYVAGQVSFFELPKTSTSANVANQADIMEELCGITELGKKADVLNDEIKNNKKELETLKRVQSEIDNQKAQYTDKLKAIQDRIDHWDQIKTNDISTTKSKINKLKTVDFDFQKECLKQYSAISDAIKTVDLDLNSYKKSINDDKLKLQQAIKWQQNYDTSVSELKDKIAKFDGVDFTLEEKNLALYDELQTFLSNETASINANADVTKKNSKRMSEIADELDHLMDNKCPYCRQQFTNVKQKIEELETEKSNLYRDNVELEKNSKKIASIVEKLEDQINDVKSKLKYSNLSIFNQNKSSYTKSVSELAVYEAQTNPYAEFNLEEIERGIEQLEASYSKLNQDKNVLVSNQTLIKDALVYSTEAALLTDLHQLNTLEIDLAKLESSVNPHIETLNDMSSMTFDTDNYKKIDELESTLEHQAFLYKLLTKKESFIRKGLLSKNLKFLNERLKHYLDMLGMPHKVKFTEELSASISQFGNQLDYDNLSNGQKARVNLALSFSFRDVLQKRYGKISFCILDECLDVGLGTVGVQLAARMIKDISNKNKISMFIISHRDEIANLFPNVMEIELENGFSRILDSKLSETKMEP